MLESNPRATATIQLCTSSHFTVEIFTEKINVTKQSKGTFHHYSHYLKYNIFTRTFPGGTLIFYVI